MRLTSPPGQYVVLYDGQCPFCTASVKRLQTLARRETIAAVDFQQPGVLDRFPGLSHEQCMRQMHLVTPTGRVYGGFEAAVQAIATRPILGWIAYLYYLPGLRWLLDRLYAFIAARRYRMRQGDACPTGTCGLHGLAAITQPTRAAAPGEGKPG